jgi:5-methylcytosine-specific restriction endonuclease McrA
MIPIQPHNLIDILEEYYLAVHYFAVSKGWLEPLDKWLHRKGYSFETVIKAKHSLLKELKDIYSKEDTPKEFQEIYKTFSNSSKGLPYINGQRKKIVYSGLDLIDRLGITVCPYCNRTFVQSITQENNYHGKRRTCEFDHFFPQSEYPFLAISFFNLIPSCKTCNHIKGTNPINFSPYDEEINGQDLITFKYKIEGADFLSDSQQVAIDLDWINEDFHESNGKVLGLDDLYRNHNDIAHELLRKRHVYNDSRIDELWETYGNEIFSSKDEIIQMIAGNYIQNEDLGKRPLAKLTRDIAREVGLLKE